MWFRSHKKEDPVNHRYWLLAIAWLYLGCLGNPKDPDPINQIRQAEDLRRPEDPGVPPTTPPDGTPDWFLHQGITFVIPGARCDDDPAFVPAWSSCSDLWRGFPNELPAGFVPPRTEGWYAARWVIMPEALPLDGPETDFWVYRTTYQTDGGEEPNSRSWGKVTAKRTAAGLLFRQTDTSIREERPLEHGGRCTHGLYSHSLALDTAAQWHLAFAGYRMDVFAMGAFIPFRDGNLEGRVTRAQSITDVTLSPPTVEHPISPQQVIRRDDGCWFVVNRTDTVASILISPTVRKRTNYVKTYFALTQP